MTQARRHTGTHAFFYGPGKTDVIQKGDMLLPRETNHHAQAMSLGNIQQPAWWNRVQPDSIKTMCSHFREVPLHCLGTVTLSIDVWLERSICRATNIPFHTINEEKLPTCTGP